MIRSRMTICTIHKSNLDKKIANFAIISFRLTICNEIEIMWSRQFDNLQNLQKQLSGSMICNFCKSMIQNSKMTKRYDPDIDLQIANDDHWYDNVMIIITRPVFCIVVLKRTGGGHWTLSRGAWRHRPQSYPYPYPLFWVLRSCTRSDLI